MRDLFTKLPLVKNKDEHSFLTPHHLDLKDFENLSLSNLATRSMGVVLLADTFLLLII